MFTLITMLLIIAGAVGWYFLKKHQNQSALVNRRTKPKQRLQIPEHSDANASADEDADSVLGLQAKAEKPEETVETGRSEELIVLYLVSGKSTPYKGYELLQALLSNGFRFGRYRIFHRHASKNGRGPVLFSLASAHEPGTFELPKMGAYTTPGLVFMLQLDGSTDHEESFDILMDTAKQLTEDLGGELWDETRNRLTMDKVMELRKRVRQYESAKRIPDLFDELN